MSPTERDLRQAAPQLKLALHYVPHGLTLPGAGYPVTDAGLAAAVRFGRR